MKRHSGLLFASGLFVGLSAALIGIFVPGGGLYWFLHTRTGVIGPTLGLALIGAGAVTRRLERSESETHAQRREQWRE